MNYAYFKALLNVQLKYTNQIILLWLSVIIIALAKNDVWSAVLKRMEALSAGLSWEHILKYWVLPLENEVLVRYASLAEKWSTKPCQKRCRLDANNM